MQYVSDGILLLLSTVRYFTQSPVFQQAVLLSEVYRCLSFQVPGFPAYTDSKFSSKLSSLFHGPNSSFQTKGLYLHFFIAVPLPWVATFWGADLWGCCLSQSWSDDNLSTLFFCSFYPLVLDSTHSAAFLACPQGVYLPGSFWLVYVPSCATQLQ